MANDILKEIMELKAAKVNLIRDAKTDSELKTCILKCNRIDLLLLPLYYTWEHILGNKSDIKEEYLSRSYLLFQQNAESLTKEVISMLADMYTNFIIDKTKSDTLYEIYQNLIIYIQQKEKNRELLLTLGYVMS